MKRVLNSFERPKADPPAEQPTAHVVFDERTALILAGLLAVGVVVGIIGVLGLWLAVVVAPEENAGPWKAARFVRSFVQGYLAEREARRARRARGFAEGYRDACESGADSLRRKRSTDAPWPAREDAPR